jgi:hypothetical protein
VFGVGPGTARIFATDPATGITSGDASVFSLGALIGLDLHSGYRGEVIPVGATVYYRVRGVYENGTLNLGARGGYTLESSDPSVLEIVSPYFVRGVIPGKATLTARDTATGAIATSALVTVKGALESITLVPATATRGIGEWESFTATGHYAPDLTSNLTQYLFYGSSDPSVAVADNTRGQRSRIRTIGAGTTTITAFDPGTQVSASAELTVLPGTIDRVTIEPAEIVRNLGNGFSFTAIGHYPGGATINVTQVVTWQSSCPTSRRRRTPPASEPRKALLPGVAGIAAVHPSGVSSRHGRRRDLHGEDARRSHADADDAQRPRRDDGALHAGRDVRRCDDDQPDPGRALLDRRSARRRRARRRRRPQRHRPPGARNHDRQRRARRSNG